jgi:hypothetical protein
MKSMSKMCVWVLILSVLNLQVPIVAFAAQAAQYAKPDSITKNPPEMVASPEVPLPEGAKPEAKKSNTWLWWALGAVAVGAAAAGGGGGGGGGSSIPPSSTGNVNVAW